MIWGFAPKPMFSNIFFCQVDLNASLWQMEIDFTEVTTSLKAFLHLMEGFPNCTFLGKSLPIDCLMVRPPLLSSKSLHIGAESFFH